MMFSKKFNKKAHFEAMLNDVEKVLSELEFKKFVALNEREFERRKYDMSVDALSRIEARIKAGEPVDEKTLEEKKSVEKYRDDIKKQIDAIDASIAGGAPSDLLPDGAEGIDNKMKTWAQKREYIRAFIDKYC